MKCKICRNNEAEWAFQPFGVDEKWSFTLLGNHYRGFPVIKICNECKHYIQNPKDAPRSFGSFEYKGKIYCIFENEVLESPF